ncbi:MAG: hypothetical protein ACNA71_01075 [Kiritimatiellia bacterium]
MRFSFGACKRLKAVDFFAFCNAILFLVMCVVTYYERFLDYRGRGNVYEFYAYAAVIVSGILILWWYLRRFTFQPAILLLIQGGILAHFAGGFIPVDGERLYDVYIFAIRYDKYVHFLNALGACLVVNHIFSLIGVRIPLLRDWAILLIVMGLGAFVEVLEYFVMLTIPDAGVGHYDNNMQDLVSNMVGGIVFLLGHRWYCERRRNL